MASKKTPVEAAKALLLNEGYTVTKKRPDPRIGDIVEIEGEKVLIIFHQKDRTNKDDHYRFGGYCVQVGVYAEMDTDAPSWIDEREWHDESQYPLLGHIDLTKAMM